MNEEYIEQLIDNIETKFNINDKKTLFFIIINCCLISKIRTEKNNGDDILRKVYPYIFEYNVNENIDYDTKECLEFIEYISTNNSEDIIGYLYEKSIPIEIRKDYGTFYTRSNNIINYMIENANVNYNQKILEPSCGSGLFIINIIKNILNNTKEEILENTLCSIFNNIQANDCDEVACRITEANIIITTIDYIKKILLINPEFKLPKLKITSLDFCYYNVENEKDLIISNPPYVTMYGKRSRNMTEEKRAYYNTFDFVRNKKGNNKFNLVMFFIEKGLKSLKKGGKLIYIVDISFFETAFIDLRKYILENCFIESITTNISEFQDVASGQVILSLIKDKDIKQKTVWYDYKDNKITEIDQTLWYDEKNNYKFYVPLSNFEESICKKVNNYKTIDYYFPGKSLRTCCALTGRTDDFLVEKNKETDNIIFPYLEGSKGITNKFAKPQNTKYIEYNYELQLKISDEFKIELEKLGVKNKKRVTLGDKEAYLAPKIFIRQSANEIIATYTEEPFAANNSIYILTNKEDNIENKKLLKYVCGILNSDLITFYSRINNIIRTGVGKTPQIKISDLKNIKISINSELYEKIIELVEELLINYDNNKIKELNSMIYSVYNINSEEINYIDKYLKKDE